MTFGEVWRESDSGFWDQMWSMHRDSPMTKRLLTLATAQQKVCEVGCGYGHFAQAMIDAGWEGEFFGFEMAPGGAERVEARCGKAGVSATVVAGDFVEHAARAQLPACDVALSRGVVQHQAHWLPMVAAMARIAPVVLVGIGYVSGGEYHQGALNAPAGHYDVRISPVLLQREAQAAGFSVELERFRNRRRRCAEVLATVRRA